MNGSVLSPSVLIALIIGAASVAIVFVFTKFPWDKLKASPSQQLLDDMATLKREVATKLQEFELHVTRMTREHEERSARLTTQLEEAAAERSKLTLMSAERSALFGRGR